jgi:putative membrane protein
MKTLVIKWFVLAVAVFLVAKYMPGIHIEGWKTAFIAAAVLGLLNTIVKPVLWILTLPITVLTLGLFSFFLNGIMFFVATKFVEGFTVTNIWWAVIGAFVVSLVSTIGNKLLMGLDEKTD